MKRIVSPAVLLANRLQFSQKFLLLFIIFAVPLLVALSSLYQSLKLETQRALVAADGKQLVLAIKPIALNMAKHRGVTSQSLNGAPGKRPVLLKLEATIDGLFAEYQRTLGLYPEFDARVLGAEQLERRWQGLKTVNATRNAGMNFQEHSDLIASVLQLVVRITDASGARLTDDIHEYYLADLVAVGLPGIQELMGQLRGKAAGAIADNELSEDEMLAVTGLLNQVKSALIPLEHQLEMVVEVRSDLAQPMNSYEDALIKFVQQVDLALSSHGEQPSSDQLFASGTQVIAELGVINKESSSLLEQSAQDKLDNLQQRQRWVLLVSIIIAATIAYLMIGIVIAIHNSVSEVLQSSKTLAEGDLRQRIVLSCRDSMADVSAGINRFTDSISHLVSNIQGSSQSIGEVSDSLRSSASASKSEIEQQRDQTHQVATAATEMAATVREVAANCAVAAETTQEVDKLTVTGEEAIRSTAQVINGLRTDTETVSTTIAELSHSVESIGGVIDVISSIAEQTNLLALNAAIEAARAGEQGRGFSVVADEVRVLAQRTQDSTTQIHKMIESLQLGSDAAVNASSKVLDQVSNAVESVGETSEALLKIRNEMQTLADLNTQVATATEQQSGVAQEISRNTALLSDVAENVLGQVDSTFEASDKLTQFVSELDTHARRFVLR